MGSDNSTVLNHLERNRYFLTGGDGYFLAGNQIFRIHRYFLERESPVFRQWFQSSGVPGGPPNGQTESTAILLKVPPASFEKLLNVFYNEKYSVYNWSVEDWTTIIELAQEWEFPEVLELALRELSRIDIPLISRIEIYQRLHIDQKHLLPLYAKLCIRKQGLDHQESEIIGLETTVLVFNARERLRAQLSNGTMGSYPAKFKDSDVMAALGVAAPHTNSDLTG